MTARSNLHVIKAITYSLGLIGLLFLGGCVTQPTQLTHGPTPNEVRADIARRIAPSVKDRNEWSADIQAAFQAQKITPNPENICSVLAVIEQEAGYFADPKVPNLHKIAREEIDRRAASMHIPKFAVSAALKLKSTDGRSYELRLSKVSTERELSEIYEDLISRVPLGKRLFGSKNPVQTGGTMQVSIPFAEANAKDYPYPITDSIRREVFTRRGGLYFGIKHLLGYETPYTRKIHRFADYNAGWYASRNAAFQHAVTVATGIPLETDGDLLIPGASLDSPSKTELAVRSLSTQLGMDERSIRRQLERSTRLDFNDTELHAAVFTLAESAGGKALPRAIIPGIQLESPKITRQLTTEWFANRVDGRYRNCLNR